MKLALIGCGRLNDIVARACQDGTLAGYELVAVMGRDPKRTEEFAQRFGCKACNTIDQLLAQKPDFTAEAASVQAIRDYAPTVLAAGSNLVVLSIGALADQQLYAEVKKAAADNGKRVYLASGAVGGFDVLRTASLMGPITMSFSSKKSPKVVARTPLATEGIEDVQVPTTVFEGTAEQAIQILPTQVNVAVATALASAGPTKTNVSIAAVPGFEGDEYKLELVGTEVKTDLNIYSRTSAIAGYSVVGVLQNAISPIVL